MTLCLAPVQSFLAMSRAIRCGRGLPVRARLAAPAQDSRWSSVRAQLAKSGDELVSVAPLLERGNERFGDLIDAPLAPSPCPRCAPMSAMRAAKTIGRPLGSAPFLGQLANLTGRDPRARRRGPGPKPMEVK